MKSDIRSDILKSAKVVSARKPPQIVTTPDALGHGGKVKKTHVHGKHTKAGKSHLGMRNVSATKIKGL